MSLRRVGADDGTEASLGSSMDAAIGALTDRLPVATRLNHVLAIGAKLKLGQLGQQGKQQQQQRELVNTDAYHRGLSGTFHVRNSYTYRGAITQAHLIPYRNAVAAWKGEPNNPVAQEEVLKQTHILAGHDTTLRGLDFLRQEDAYVCLLYIFNTNTQGTPRNENAKFMLQESLYHDKDEQAYNHHITSTLAMAECTLAAQYLGPGFAFDPVNTLTPYDGFGLNVGTKQRMIDEKISDPSLTRARERASQMQLDRKERQERMQRQAENARAARRRSHLRGNVGPTDKFDMRGNPYDR